MYTKRLGRIALIVGVILLIPLVGTWVSEHWLWSPFDFLIAGALLFGTGVLIDMAVRKIEHPFKKLLAILTILGLLVLMWGELAVQIVSQTLKLLF